MSDWLQQLSELEQKATPEKWYVVGPPWGDGGFVVAGNSDPHVGSYVCNTDDLLVMDDEEAKEHGASNKLADADFITALRNSAKDLIERARRAEELERENGRMCEQVSELQSTVRRADQLAANAEHYLYGAAHDSQSVGKARTTLAGSVDVWRDDYPEEAMSA